VYVDGDHKFVLNKVLADLYDRTGGKDVLFCAPAHMRVSVYKINELLLS
jgi:hypothetical protein